MQGEKVTGTFLYSASSKSYVLHHLVFTSSRMLCVSADWEERNLLVDIISAILRFPFIWKKSDPLFMKTWAAIASRDYKNIAVNYHDPEAEKIVGMGLPELVLHEISVMPFGMVKRVTVKAHPNGYRLDFLGAPLASQSFLIPVSSFEDFRSLLSKTPLADRLSIEGVTV